VRTTTLPAEAGWYVICNSDSLPLYVGTAKDLNARLNTDEGSRDGFANPKRTSDPERNFIKAFMSAGVLSSVSVVIVREAALCERIGIAAPLKKIDRQNVEKIINIFRARLFGLVHPRWEREPA
jgi:hypothetical protein